MLQFLARALLTAAAAAGAVYLVAGPPADEAAVDRVSTDAEPIAFSRPAATEDAEASGEPDHRIRWDAAAEAAPWSAVARIGEAGPEALPGVPSSRRSALFRRAFRGDAAATARLRPKLAAADQDVFDDLVEWLSRESADRVSWPAFQAFAARRPDWPIGRRLQSRVEAVMPEQSTPQSVVAFFEEREPRTARGLTLLGEARRALGDAAQGEAMLIEAFAARRGTGAVAEWQLSRRPDMLAPHVEARHDMLLVRERLSDARRLHDRLPPERAALTDAVSLIIRGRRGAAAAVAALPAALRQHPAIRVADMRRSHERGRRREAERLTVLASEEGALVRPESWASRRRSLARDALEEGRVGPAYALASGHGLSRGSDFAELEWYAGWVALTELASPKLALMHFERLHAGVRSPISRGRAAYWAGMAAADGPARRAWLLRAAEHPQSFYGHVAAERLGLTIDLNETTPTPSAFDAAGSDLGRAAAMLYAGGRAAEGRRFLEALARARWAARRNAADLAAVARYARALGDPWAEIRVGKVAERDGAPLWPALYPAPRRPAFTGGRTDAALLLAVARQESRFNIFATSHAGAQGLMQLMPATARMNARDLGLPYERARLTRDPTYNLRLGDAHMARVLRYYRGSALLAAAGYNAGEGNVNKWIDRFGDPRDPDVDPIWWIEMIPFDETRNYVQRVLEAKQIYTLRLSDGAGPARIGADLGAGRLRDPALGREAADDAPRSADAG